MMGSQEERLTNWIRDALIYLYDNPRLEKHPLADRLEIRPGRGSRADALRRLLLEAVESLRVSGLPLQAAGQRPYRVLLGRYVEGRTTPELETELALSSRQIRREQKEGLEAMASFLRQRMHQRQTQGPDAGPLPAATETVDTDELLEGIVETLKPLARERGVDLQVEFSTPLPPVSAARITMRLALLNLLRRAVTASQKVVVRVKPSGKRVELHVEASGQAGRIWPLDEKPNGLTKAERLLQDSGGNLVRLGLTGRVEAAVVQLPVALRPTVLVIDDEPSDVRMYTRYLSRQAYKVQGVTDPREAFRLATEMHVDAILLDVMMPHLDGWEFLQRLRTNPETRDVPVVVCSVWNEPDLALSLGASEFLRKPVTQQQLLSALRRLLPDVHEGAAARPGEPAGTG